MGGLDIEKRRRNRFGVNANVLRLCGLNLGSPSKVWVGEVIRRPQTGTIRGFSAGRQRRRAP